jgi:hypothetical protein
VYRAYQEDSPEVLPKWDKMVKLPWKWSDIRGVGVDYRVQNQETQLVVYSHYEDQAKQSYHSSHITLRLFSPHNDT